MSVSEQASEHRESNSGPDPNPGLLTLRNGLVGGIVAVLLSVLPLSTVLGGGVAGYLERGRGKRGSAAAVVAGLVAFVPYVLASLYVALTPSVSPPGPTLVVSPGLIVAVAGFALVYVVGLSVLGGLIGGYVYDEHRS